RTRHRRRGERFNPAASTDPSAAPLLKGPRDAGLVALLAPHACGPRRFHGPLTFLRQPDERAGRKPVYAPGTIMVAAPIMAVTIMAVTIMAMPPLARRQNLNRGSRSTWVRIG